MADWIKMKTLNSNTETDIKEILIDRKKFFKKILWHSFNLAVLDDDIEVDCVGNFVIIKAKVLSIENAFFDSKEMFNNYVEKNKNLSTYYVRKINLLDLFILKYDGLK